MDTLSKAKKISPERVDWVDILKGITIVLVVMHHSIITSNVVIDEAHHQLHELLNKLNYLASYARMPAFFLASGIVMASIKSKGNLLNWFLCKRLPLMLWVILLWTIISVLVTQLDVKLYPWVDQLLFVEGYYFPFLFGNLWFIYALLLLSGYAAVVYKFKKVLQVAVTILFSLAIHSYLQNNPLGDAVLNTYLSNIAYKGLPFFMIGFIYKAQIMGMFANAKTTIISLLVLVPLIILASKLVPTVPVMGFDSMLFRFLPFTLFFVGVVVLLSHWSLIKKVFTDLGKRSLEIFLLHQFFIALFFALYKFLPINNSYMMQVAVFVVCPILSCLIFIYLFGSFLKPLLFSLPVPMQRQLNRFNVKADTAVLKSNR